MDYNDPLVPRTHKMRRHDLQMHSMPLTAESLRSYDCVLVSTNHAAYDWQLVADHAKLVVDTRKRQGQARPHRRGLMILIRRFMRAAARRVVWPTRVLILRAGPLAQAPPAPAGFWPVRVSASSMPESIVHRVTESMWRAGEACAEVAARLAHGDECFAWQSEHGIASFGWVTYRDRVVGPLKLLDADKRAFLYNFYTAPEFRGRGLYPTLLLYVRHALAGDGKTDMIIDVNVRNDRSLRGIGKAGFTPVARITYLTLFQRYNWTLGRAILSQSDNTLLA